jgi:hypothetical protein
MASADASDFVKALEEADLVGLSDYNPNDLQNNCVFVTLAYLLGLPNVDALNQELVSEMATRTKGVPFLKVVDVLHKTGREFVWKSWKGNPTASGVKAAAPLHGGPPVKGTNVAWMRDEQFLLGEWNVKQIGICYKRPAKIDPKTKQVLQKSTGHCIVLKEGDPQKGPSYLCYQKETNGKDAWKDARGDLSLEPEEGTKVIGAFAIIDEKDILERGGPKGYEQHKPPPPSGTAMLNNTAAAIVQPAVGAIGQALVAHVSTAVSAKH